MTTVLTPNLGLPYPDDDENVDVAADVGALARAVDAIGPVPVGSLVMWPTATPPQFWLLCNGLTVPEATYPKLAVVLGATGGMITLPDMRGRVGIGADTDQALGSVGGAKQVQLTGAQSGQKAGATGLRDRSQAHAHGVYISAAAAVNGTPPVAGKADWGVPQLGFNGVNSHNIWAAYAGSAYAADAPDHGHYLAASAAVEAHENRPPFQAVNFIIRAS
jgi:microcystin-dependent protein